jgi:very-short-patch-repair endonuclease
MSEHDDRMDVARTLGRFTGLATRAQLRQNGCTDHHIRAYVETGAARVIRRSWLATQKAPVEAVRAVELGGILGGESALRNLGVWVSHETGLCVAAPRTASRLPVLREHEYRIHPRTFVWPTGIRWRMDVVDALVVIAGRVTYEHLVASIDSALHTGVLSARQLDVLFTRLPGRLRFARALVDRRSESGIESLFRIAAIEQGWDVQVQVEIDGLGRADHVINGWLIIETDGDEHHSTKEQRANDRRRDAIAVRRGMRAHRFGHRQIMDDLDACIEVVADILAAGRPFNA